MRNGGLLGNVALLGLGIYAIDRYGRNRPIRRKVRKSKSVKRGVRRKN